MAKGCETNHAGTRLASTKRKAPVLDDIEVELDSIEHDYEDYTIQAQEVKQKGHITVQV